MALSARVSSPAALRAAAATRSVRAAAAATGADRPLWFPGAKAPAYLDGTLDGDYGSLTPPQRQNGRWAMLAVAGILTTELQNASLGVDAKWWQPDAGSRLVEGYQPGWLVPGGPVVGAEILLFAVIEAARLQHFTKFGPGAKAFDPAGLSERPDARLKEIKNGRLAMLAFIGFTSQAAVRGLGPLACLNAHLADPGHVNIFTSSVGAEATVAVVALSLIPLALSAQRILKAKDDVEEFRPIPW